jgi:hypothetical protein
MSDFKYNTLTLGLYVISITLAIFLQDIGLLFDLTAAVSCTCLMFIFPGIFYL